jgi:O-antigen ligase
VTQLAEAPAKAPLRPTDAPPAQQRRQLPAGWPLAAILCFYPVWWALGIGQFAFVIFAVPMVRQLWRRRPLALPPAFGLWLLFLLWYVLCLVMLPFAAPASLSGSFSGRIISIAIEILELASVTITLVYVGNISTTELSQRRLQKWMSVLFLVTVAGGLLALAAPYFQFTSPLEVLLPRAIRANTYAASLVHPNAAQVQDVLGYTSPRPAAPWTFTNYWANNLSILLVWFCLYMWFPARLRRRGALVLTLILATVTIVYSLNRGLWIGLVVSFAFLIVSLARRGDLRSSLATVALIPIIVVAFLASPLHTIVGQRASHGGSNDIRTFLDEAAVKGAIASPIVGWGGTRKALGSSQSIAVGPSTACTGCGAFTIGSTGQIWQIMYSEGLLGALLYVGFFIALWWRLRQDRSSIGAAARLIIWLTLLYSVFYNNLPVALTLVMISVGMSWRNLLTSSANPPQAVAP